MHYSKSDFMRVCDLLDQNNVFPELEVQSKQELISILVDTLNHHVSEELTDRAREAVMNREDIMSTGVGRGLAIPHGKTTGLDRSYAAFARLVTPIEYGAIDGEPVKMVFLLVGPEAQNSLHIKMLSRVSRLLNNQSFREKLENANNTEKILEAFRNEEEQFIKV